MVLPQMALHRLVDYRWLLALRSMLAILVGIGT